MRWLIAGASGFLGSALTRDLIADGQLVTRLVRRPARGAAESTWDPAVGVLDSELVAAADVVVNLAGASVGRLPWTRSYKARIRSSRVDTTALLAEAVADAANSGRAPVYLVQSAIGWYPKDTDDQPLDEDADAGTGFLASVVSDWERASDPAAVAGARVARLRTGLVADASGGALRSMLIPFRFGLGARLGSGRQYMPLVTLADWVAAVRFVAAHPECSGPYNVVMPEPATNAEFTHALAERLGRPARLAVPAGVLRLALGGFSAELLGSVRLVPKRLLEAGFRFDSPDVETLARNALTPST